MTIDTTKAREVTQKHIDRVQVLLGQAIQELLLRGRDHDRSKFNYVELEPLARMQELVEREGQAPFGSEEYERRKAMLTNMLKHHYFHNTHHPEHFENGVSGMDLFDLMEMFFDWKAASERGEDDAMGISYCVEKYDIPPVLEAILRNTADNWDFKHK